MSRRERRSVSLGRHRDRTARDPHKPIEEDLSTRHNISNFLLTLQRVQAAEEENRQLRKENQLLRQRARSSRLSSASFRDSTYQHNTSSSDDAVSIQPGAEDEMIAAETKRNSLIFVGDAVPSSPEHAALEAQYKRLQEDFDTVKEFLKHLFQHALAISSSGSESLALSKDGGEKEAYDVNTYNPAQSKQLERNLEDIHGQISQLRNSQDQQQVKMEQVHQALDNVLCQSSVRNDVTMRIVRQQDKMREMTRHVTFLESHLMTAMKSLRQAEERLRQSSDISHNLSHFVAINSKHLKGNTKDDLSKLADQLSGLSKRSGSCTCKMSAVSKLLSQVSAAVQRGETLGDSKPPADIVDSMSKLERLVGSDWHRLGRMLGLSSDSLEDIGKFTNFDLTSRVEKVLISWVKQTRGAGAESLRQALDKMDRDILLLAESPVCKDWFQLPSDVITFSSTHVIDVQTITNFLANQGVIGQDTRSFILGSPQEHRRAARMLQTVVFMGLQALYILCAALERHNQNVVASKIRGCLPSNCLSEDVNGKSDVHSQTLQSSSPKLSSKTVYSGSNTLTTPPSHSGKTPSSSSSSKSQTPNSKSNEKQRKKRSRSLFTRKNKLRDTEADYDHGFDAQGEFYYPALNMNVHSHNYSSSTSGESGKRSDETPTSGRQKQYGRQNPQRPFNYSSSIDGVVV
ncbi:uncharacterized protein LOC101845785 [Aplysia californica]|uniref:Uncharacterized protein LOC101845785 n=1 Tax=Aplysia californica TaxID=6500 RepID=A0ABM1A442_APLCA|nr:uncharacterized protein LOC101845785 [Aplysia californica]